MSDIPETSYILTAIREMYIKYADPSQMGRDLYNGLKEKEHDLSLLTHEKLLEVMGSNYAEKESVVANTIKSGLTQLLIGTRGPDDVKMVEPDIYISSFYEYYASSSSSSSSSSGAGPIDIYTDTPYGLDIELSGGNIEYSKFTYTWAQISGPYDWSTEFEELSDYTSELNRLISTKIIFRDPGVYVLQFTIQHSEFSSFQIFQRVMATVV